MIKNFKDFLNEEMNVESSAEEAERREAERDTMEYDSSLDSLPEETNDYPDVEDDFSDGEEEEEEE